MNYRLTEYVYFEEERRTIIDIRDALIELSDRANTDSMRRYDLLYEIDRTIFQMKKLYEMLDN